LPPDDGYCEGILSGTSSKATTARSDLDDLNVAMSVVSRQRLGERQRLWGDAIVIDERVDEAQRAALQSVFSGQVGGWSKRFMTWCRANRGFVFAPITVEIADLSS
jgi:hypothetical protein